MHQQTINNQIFDVAIIGAGPSGLFAAFEAGMFDMNAIVIDASEALGGQCSALYPHKPIFDIPAIPTITGLELVNALLEQNKRFNPTYLTNTKIIGLEECDNLLKLITNKNEKISARSLIVAAGSGIFCPVKPDVVDINKFEEAGNVIYHISDVSSLRNKNIVIAGGGDSAIDIALMLHGVARHIYFVHRRANFRAHNSSVSLLHQKVKEGNIELIIPYQLQSISGENGVINHVLVSDLDGNTKALNADILVPCFGLKQNIGPIENFGVNIANGLIITTPSTMQTSRDMIFAIGDIASYPGKLKLILSAFSEAAIACSVIAGKLYNTTHTVHSTSKFIKG